MFGKRKTKFDPIRIGDYTIRAIDKSDWQDFREIYLQAIKTEPTLIVDEYTQRKKEQDDYWRRWIEDIASDQRSLLVGIEARGQDGLIGFAIIRGRPESELAHVAELVPLYLLDRHHDEALEKKILEHVFDYLDQFTEIRKLQTLLTTKDVQHLTVYNEAGFVRYGFDQNHFKIGKTFYDCVLLAKQL